MILTYGELGKKSDPLMGFEPTPFRDLVGCSNQLSQWKHYGEQKSIFRV